MASAESPPQAITSLAGCSLPGYTEAELASEGWKRCFIADEPRLSEAVQTYQELGYDVALMPVSLDDEGCTECMRLNPDRFRIIYTRK